MSVSKEPLSIRNNNPGNLRFANQPGATPGEGGFARFETPEAGLSAMQRQIELDTQERGLTLSAFLNKYAPPSENKTSNYIDFVAKKTGLDPSSVVPAERIGDLQRAMIEMEGGPRSLSHFTQVSTAQAPTKAPGPRPTVQVASANQLPESYRMALAANYLGDTEKESVTDQAMKLLEEIQSEDGGSGASSTRTKIGSILAPSEKTVDPFAIMAKAQEESEPKRRPVPRMPVRFAEGGEAKKFSDEQVSRYLKERPELTDRQIAEAMNKYNVSQEQVSRVTGVTMPEVQRRYREATALTARPTLEGVGALWNKLHEKQFGQPVNLATTSQENALNQLSELQKETARQQAEWDAKYGAGIPKAGTPMPTWGETYGAWAPLHQQRFGTMINRPWNADIDAQNQKLALDQQYIQAVRDYNTKYGTNYAPEESVLGIDAQPNPFYRVPDKDDDGLGAFLGMAGTIGGMYLFPGMDFNSMLYRNLLSTAATEGGKRLFKDGGEVNRRAPSISEVPQVDVQGRVVRDAPVPQPTFTPGQQLIGAGETALSALSGLTAPASIAYDVLRGVPAKEVSPSRFMYEPRTEAGQETLQNVGRLAQEYKLDAALPQVQLQRPYPVGAAARQGIAGIEKGVEKMTLPTFRKITGNPEATKEQMMDFVLNQKSIMQAGAPAISRAPGGTFFTSEGSQLSRLISRGATEAMESAGGDVEKATAAAEMFNKKARDFFEKRAGSISDELKKEMIAGRIKMPGEVGEELFPKYLIREAESGDISAMRDLERRYDQMLGIRQINLAKEDIAEPYAETERMSQSIKQNILAQFKQHPELIPDDLLSKLTNKDPADVADIRTRLKNNPEYFSVVLEPKISKLININAENVNPSDIARYEGLYGRYATENLSKNELEALKRGQPLLDISSGYMDFFGYDIKDLARQAGKMSTQELKDINFATFVSRASKLAVKQKTLEARADEIQESIKNNKFVDPEALAFGTEVFQELPDGSTWRKIVDPDATLIQSAVLDNSIKGYANYGSYGPFNNGRKALEDGNVELFVLYDKNGMPVTNVEMVKGEKSGKFSMRQAQGNGPLTSNVTPEDYLPQLKAFINKTTPEDIPFNISKELRYVDAPEGFAKGGIVDKPLYDRAA
jgi:hypothetical protein